MEQPDLDLFIKTGKYIYEPVASGPLLPIIPWPTLFSHSAGADEAPPVIHIEIQITSKVEGLAFDPMRTTLRHPQGQQLIPTSYIGPIEHFERSGLIFYNRQSSSQKSEKIVLTPSRPTCFILEFDMTNSRSWDFDLSFNGIENSPHPSSPLNVHFEKASEYLIIWGGREGFCNKFTK